MRAAMVGVWVAVAIGAVACGGGGGSSAAGASSLTGLAATGAGLPHASVTAKCASGTALTGTTDATGSYTLVLDGQALPCLLQVTGGTPSVTLHSFAQAAGRVNITPVTDLIVANALAGDPAAAFASYTPAQGSTLESGLSAAKAYVATQISAIAGSSIADPLTGSFSVGDADDRILDALGNALTAAGKTQAQLRAQAQTSATLTATVAPYLAAPAGLSATVASSTAIDLAWSAVPGATSYKVYRGTSAGVSTAGAALATVSNTSLSDTGLAPSTAYYYKVVASNAVVTAGTVSSEVNATTQAAGGGSASTWTFHALSNGAYFQDTVWDGQKFVAIGSYVGTSTDGATWNFNALLAGKGIAVSGSTLLLSGISTSTGSDVRKSVDGGANWTSPATANIFTVAGNATMFVGIGGGSEAGNGQAMAIRTSTSGDTWTTRYTESVPNAQAKITSHKPIWSGSKWLISAVKFDPNQANFYDKYEFFVLTSSDGLTWTKTVVSNVKGNYSWPWWAVWNGTEFALIDKGKTLKSSDAVTWALASNSFTASTYDFVGWTGTEYVAFSGGGASVTLWKSADALNWTATATSATQPIYGAASSGSLYLAVGNQFVFTSP